MIERLNNLINKSLETYPKEDLDEIDQFIDTLDVEALLNQQYKKKNDTDNDTVAMEDVSIETHPNKITQVIPPPPKVEYIDTSIKRPTDTEQEEEKHQLFETPSRELTDLLRVLDIESSRKKIRQPNFDITEPAIDTNLNLPQTARTNYPFIRWYQNSCAHDSFMAIFYFTVYTKDDLIRRSTQPLAQTLLNCCKAISNIPKSMSFTSA